MAMILAWSVGEAIGYLTKRPPKELKLAPTVTENPRAVRPPT
jgi:hypothetical protein